MSDATQQVIRNSVLHHPHFGHTRAGLAVHLRTVDHLRAIMPSETKYQRFNMRMALGITKLVGTMTCFWVFLFIAFLSLPATLVLAAIFHAPAHVFFLTFFLSYGFIFLVDWLCQNVIQLILLPALMVGQNLQNAANDARFAKQFEDGEWTVQALLALAQHLQVELPPAPGKAPAAEAVSGALPTEPSPS